MICSISLFVEDVEDPEPPTVNPNGIKTLLDNGLSTYFINGNPAFSDGLISLPRNPPTYTILND